MRFSKLALGLSAFVFAACGGGGDQAAESAPAMEAPAAAPAAPAMDSSAMAGGAAITGTTHTIRMLGDDKGYRFEPADLTIKVGDGIKFDFVSGGPHNVAFEAAGIPAGAAAVLNAAMANRIGELSGPMMLNAGESYTVSFAGVPAGKYAYNCTPHVAMNMKGVITVEP
jgi:plastocyanin